ncbi:tyrosine-type recombinase/integrase [Planctomicrobium sp. SH668]|uniref:tyrosine-type recombinase/integrase n=1 Tax=Planctomicrobium sp. SH668 TaxID=3448126 RepID=UPI003F5B15DC
MKPSPRHTVRFVFEKFYVSNDLGKNTQVSMRAAIRRWEMHTTNPTIDQISNETVAEFREGALKDGLAPSTVNTCWRMVRSILRRVGPATDGNPWGMGLISRVPAMRPVPVPFKRPVRLSMTDLNRLYLAARNMQVPRKGVPNPGYWWQALIVLTYFTGLRVSDLLKARWSDLNEEGSTLFVETRKTGVSADLPLPSVVMEHICRLDRRTQRIFHIEPRKFHSYVSRLKSLASIEKFKGFHDIRRTACSEVNRVRPGMGKVLLLHAPTNVTEASYLNSLPELRDVIEAMAVPDAFRHGPKMTLRALKESHKKVVTIRPADFTIPIHPPATMFTFTKGGFSFMGRFYRAAPARILILKAFLEHGGTCTQPQLWKAAIGTRFPLVSNRNLRAKLYNKISYCRLFLQKVFQLPPGFNPIIPSIVEDPRHGCNFELVLPPLLWEPQSKAGAVWK